MVYFTELLMSFIPAEYKDDGTYNDSTWPQDAVLLSSEEEAEYWRREAPEGKRLGAVDGRPAWVDLPPPTNAEISASNTSLLQQATLLASAQKTALNNRVGTINDAIELEMATEAEALELPERQAQLLEWKRYAVFLGRVTLQDGWALTVEWPVEPIGGMDLTVSAVAPRSLQ